MKEAQPDHDRDADRVASPFASARVIANRAKHRPESTRSDGTAPRQGHHRAFFELHKGPLPLLLPSAWDVGSALALVGAGFAAIGTTSFGVAAASGTSRLPRTRSELTRRLVAHLAQLPTNLAVDIEDGYSADPQEVADYAAALPAAGIELADWFPYKSASAGQVAKQAAKIAAIKDARPDVFVNARIGPRHADHGPAIGSIVGRAAEYIDAGADGIFVPGLRDPEVIRALTTQLPVPISIRIDSRLSLQHLADLGVRRVNTGSLLYRAAMDSALLTATSLRDGTRPPRATPELDLENQIRHAGSQISNSSSDAESEDYDL